MLRTSGFDSLWTWTWRPACFATVPITVSRLVCAACNARLLQLALICHRHCGFLLVTMSMASYIVLTADHH